MPTTAPASRPSARRVTGVIHFPGGFAWPARDDRPGNYVVCTHGQPLLTLAVCDDFGALVPVPYRSFFEGGTVRPAIEHAEGTH